MNQSLDAFNRFEAIKITPDKSGANKFRHL